MISVEAHGCCVTSYRGAVVTLLRKKHEHVEKTALRRPIHCIERITKHLFMQATKEIGGRAGEKERALDWATNALGRRAEKKYTSKY